MICFCDSAENRVFVGLRMIVGYTRTVEVLHPAANAAADSHEKGHQRAAKAKAQQRIGGCLTENHKDGRAA